MPVEAKPLFRPDVLRPYVDQFVLPAHVEEQRQTLNDWAETLRSGRADSLNETQLLPDFITHFFCNLLGYRGPVGSGDTFSINREQLVQVDGKWADAVLGEFGSAMPKYIVAVEGKGTRDPLDRPYAGRRMSAVDQAYRYAINLPCDWIIVTSMRQTRLYFKGSDQHTYEVFDTETLATDERQLRRFVFLLGAERVIPESGECHLYALRESSERVGKELTKEYYIRYADIRQDVFEHLVNANRSVPRHDMLSVAQKLLDRVLFIAFCEDRELLPADSLKKAHEHRDPYHPRSVWENFQALFHSVNEGNPALNIPLYNGGLFAEEPLLGSLNVPDAVCNHFRDLGDFDYRPASQAATDSNDAGGRSLIDVDILGHIFEQSISDLEKLRDAVEGMTQERSANERTRRRREGAFYTPAFITRYIVGETLGAVLADRFERLRAEHAADAKATARKSLEDPTVYDLESLNNPQRVALVRFWEAWQDALASVRVLDPACGSGAFLIEAFDQLHNAYLESNDRLFELRGQRTLFDLDRKILQDNLYGVDLNSEAIEICRLSLWIKTAARGKVLTSLDHTIRVGNSIVADPDIDPRAFNWQSAFPEVFDVGGFDAVVGNPPYVRQELLSDIKPYLEDNYQTYDGVADLYTYFYEAGLRVLRPGGRLSFIVTNKWMRAGYGEPLRRYFSEHAWMESVIDFGHAKQIFEQADVFPSIIVVRKPNDDPPPQSVRVCAIPREQLRIDDLREQIDTEGVEVERIRLTAKSWSLEPAAVDRLMKKIEDAGCGLAEYMGVSPQYGIKTGRNEVFLIDGSRRKQLIAEDASCSEVMKPYLRGQDLKRWSPEWAGLWMLFTRKGFDIERYPSIRRYLEQHRETLEPKPPGWKPRNEHDKWPGRKAGAYSWFELQDPVEYWESFEQDKICIQRIAYHPRVGIDRQRRYLNDSTIIIPRIDPWVVVVLNSNAMWYYSHRTLPHKKDEALAMDIPYVERLPIPESPIDSEAEIAGSTERLVEIAERHFQVRTALLDWLRVEFDITKPNRKLQAPPELESDDFAAQVRKVRGRRNPLSAAGLKALRDEYDRTILPAQELAREALTLEHRLSDLVNEAYGLTPDEIDLMWKTAPPRMPISRQEPAVQGE